MSAKHSPSTKHARSSAEPPLPLPPVARTGRHVLRSSTVGALPILNQFLRRMRLEEFLHAALPREDRRTKLSPVKALLVLWRNLLVSRRRSTEWGNGPRVTPRKRWASCHKRSAD